MLTPGAAAAPSSASTASHAPSPSSRAAARRRRAVADLGAGAARVSAAFGARRRPQLSRAASAPCIATASARRVARVTATATGWTLDGTSRPARGAPRQPADRAGEGRQGDGDRPRAAIVAADPAAGRGGAVAVEATGSRERFAAPAPAEPDPWRGASAVALAAVLSGARRAAVELPRRDRPRRRTPAGPGALDRTASAGSAPRVARAEAAELLLYEAIAQPLGTGADATGAARHAGARVDAAQLERRAGRAATGPRRCRTPNARASIASHAQCCAAFTTRPALPESLARMLARDRLELALDG